MKVLALNTGHDGCVVLIEDGVLKFAVESEKGSDYRYREFGAKSALDLLALTDGPPDAIAIGGFEVVVSTGKHFPIGAGYAGTNRPEIQTFKVFGRDTMLIHSTHERSHIWCGLGLSEIPAGQDMQVLVWEGTFGAFYKVTANGEIQLIGTPLSEPGNRYLTPYGVADPKVPDDVVPMSRLENAGKAMALAAYIAPNKAELATGEAQFLEDLFAMPLVEGVPKAAFKSSSVYNIGVESERFKHVMRAFTDRMLNHFLSYAINYLDRDKPLVLVGGCALNCEWNVAFRERWNAEVFVPPVPNDSGSAIGTAIDAWQLLTGEQRIEWAVDAGKPFEHDASPGDNWTSRPATPLTVASSLADGDVLAWVSGRHEIGPRALGHRSLVAAPFTRDMHARLNQIKGREGYRPVAPLCQEEHVSEYFKWTGPSPFMLYFQEVVAAELQTVTHIDGTARVQTIAEGSATGLWPALEAFRQRTGFGVLCNTSLNFNGTGFINSMSELVHFAEARSIDGFVVDGIFWSAVRRH